MGFFLDEENEATSNNIAANISSGFFLDDQTTSTKKNEYVPGSILEAGLTSLGDALQPITQGVTLGFADEISSGGNALIDSLMGRGNFSDNYKDYQAKYKQSLDETRSEHPLASISGELIGGFYNPLQKARLLKTAITPGALTMAKNAAKIGVQGGLYGFGTGEDTEDRITQSAIGTGLGAVGSVALESTIRGLGQLAKTPTVMNLIDKLSSKTGAVGNMTPKAPATLTAEETLLLKSLKDIPSDQVDEAIKIMQGAQAADSPVFVQEALDVPEIYQQAKTIFNTTPGRNIGQMAIKNRAAETENRLNKIYNVVSTNDDVLSAATQGKQAAEGILEADNAARARLTKPLFDKAFNRPALESERLTELANIPVVKQAAKQAEDVLTVEFGKLQPTDSRTMQQVLHGLGGKIEAAKRSGDSQLARDFTVIKKAVESEVYKLNPDLQVARKAYETISQKIGGLSKGQLEVIKNLGEEKISHAGDLIMKLEPAQIRQLRIKFGSNQTAWNGLIRSHLQNLLENTKDGQNALKNVLSSTRSRQRLEAAIGKDKFKKFSELIGYEQRIKEGQRSVFAGSPTAPIQETLQRNNSALSLIGNLLDGGFSITKNIAAKILNTVNTRDDRVLAEFANIFADPKKGYEALSKVAKYRNKILDYQTKVGGITNQIDQSAIKSITPATQQGNKLLDSPAWIASPFIGATALQDGQGFQVQAEQTRTPMNSVSQKSIESTTKQYQERSPYNNNLSNTETNQEQSANYPELNQVISKLPPIVKAIIKQESNFNPKAVSKSGARGMMQIMPEWDAKLGITDIFDPIENINAGIEIYNQELDRYGSTSLALAAFNAGSPKVNAAINKAKSREWSKVKKYLPSETQEYVVKVLKNYNEFSRG